MMKSDKINQQRKLGETDFLTHRYKCYSSTTQPTVSIRRLKALKRNLEIKNKQRVYDYNKSKKMTKDDDRHKDHHKRCRKAYSVDFSTTSNTAAASGFLNVRQTEQRRYDGLFPFLFLSLAEHFNVFNFKKYGRKKFHSFSILSSKLI